MPNFFKSVLRMGEHSVTQPFKAAKQTLQGHPGKAWKDFFHDASGMGQDVAHSVGIRGWVGSHPMQSVGALVATVFGGWAAWGAYGAGAAGAAGASATGAAGAAGGATAGSGIAAGTAIGQTVAATPGMVGAASMGGTVASTGASIGVGGSAAANAAALTSTPSLSILAGSGYGVGGSYATTLGGETAIGNTGLAETGANSNVMNWINRGRQLNNMMQQGQGQQSGGGGQINPTPWINFNNGYGQQQSQANGLPFMPVTTTELLNQSNQQLQGIQ